MGAYKPILADSWRLYKNSIWFVTYLSHFYKPILSWWRIQSSLRFSLSKNVDSCMFFFPQINVYKIYKMSSEYSFINELFSIMFTNYYVPTKLR